ncbi:MAG: thiamine phosphate synthase [Candidatus Aminicenantes bacterium]|nr:thiamine phosphate synthase [Candidatus Aminicenantes bacterium]
MTSGPAVDFGLVLVTDRGLSGRRSVVEVVEAAVRGGVTVVQLREKDAPVREFIDLGRRVREVLRPRRVPLLINDRVDVALAVLADGVHLGQNDISVADARRLLGPKAIVGLTVETIAQAGTADRDEADYLGVSPVFATPTKTDTGPAWGVEGLWRLRPLARKPLVAIGGVNETNAARLLEAGADGIAVVSAICAAPDPEEAARRLRDIVDRHRRTKGGGGR